MREKISYRDDHASKIKFYTWKYLFSLCLAQSLVSHFLKVYRSTGWAGMYLTTIAYFDFSCLGEGGGAGGGIGFWLFAILTTVAGRGGGRGKGSFPATQILSMGYEFFREHKVSTSNDICQK